MLFKLCVFVSKPRLPVFSFIVLVWALFRPATQTHSYTEMVVDGFQSSKGTTKTAGIRCATRREDYLKESTVCFCVLEVE